VLQVLIVEDDFRVAQVNRGFVEQVEGFRVIGVAASVADAERMLAELRPDLVVLDLFLPDGHGLEVLRRLRSTDHPADVIVVTGAKEAAAVQQALRGGAIDYILKPYRFERFAETLRRYREYRSQVTAAREVEQAQLDRMLWQRGAVVATAELPKGIDALTLRRVSEALAAAEEPLAAEAFGTRTGLSRTTARRYLEYLVETGRARVEHIYGDVGRPERLYRRHGK
jgi:two-component system, CitB family, response regulator